MGVEAEGDGGGVRDGGSLRHMPADDRCEKGYQIMLPSNTTLGKAQRISYPKPG